MLEIKDTETGKLYSMKIDTPKVGNFFLDTNLKLVEVTEKNIRKLPSIVLSEIKG